MGNMILKRGSNLPPYEQLIMLRMIAIENLFRMSLMYLKKNLKALQEAMKKNINKKKKSFMIKVVREKYHIKHGISSNTFYDTQQELAKFLFGISVDYVSNLLWICTKQNSTQQTNIPAAHSIFRENPWMLRQ